LITNKSPSLELLCFGNRHSKPKIAENKADVNASAGKFRQVSAAASPPRCEAGLSPAGGFN